MGIPATMVRSPTAPMKRKINQKERTAMIYYFVNNGKGIVLETTDQRKAVSICMATPRAEGHPFNPAINSTTDLVKARRGYRRMFGKDWLIGTSDIG